MRPAKSFELCLERVVRINVFRTPSEVEAPAMLEPFLQHQAPCLRLAAIPRITISVELKSRRR
jgi:hypothetical protein